MPSLSEALDGAVFSIKQEISAEVAKNIKSVTSEILEEITEKYDDFFGLMYRAVLSQSISANTTATPTLFQTAGVQSTPWMAVTPKWYEQKSRNQNPRALDFYQGLTYGVINTLKDVRRPKKKRGSGRTRTGLSFDQFIQAIAADGKSNVERFFGPIQIAYSFTRPGAGRVVDKTVDGIVTKLYNFGAKGGFAKFLDGTTVTVDISAFNKVNNISTEQAMVAWMIQESGYKEQWFKITGGGSHYRDLIMPLISYYTQYFFNSVLQDRFQ